MWTGIHRRACSLLVETVWSMREFFGVIFLFRLVISSRLWVLIFDSICFHLYLI